MGAPIMGAPLSLRLMQPLRQGGAMMRRPQLLRRGQTGAKVWLAPAQLQLRRRAALHLPDATAAWVPARRVLFPPLRRRWRSAPPGAAAEAAGCGAEPPLILYRSRGSNEASVLGGVSRVCVKAHHGRQCSFRMGCGVYRAMERGGGLNPALSVVCSQKEGQGGARRDHEQS